MKTVISCSWKQQDAQAGYAAGVSLHSHTNQSKETLSFLAAMGDKLPFFANFVAKCNVRAQSRYGIKLDFEKAYWTPPLTPMLAFDLERKQIENGLQLPALVSISDHDDIKAPMLLRSVPSARAIPVSVEWSAPYGETCFHLGIHNLPSAEGQAWMDRLEQFTANPNDAGLSLLLEELNEMPNVLVVFNHPMWDLYDVGKEKHCAILDRFLTTNNQFFHAFELNGLRNWKENREAMALARRWGQLTISGGDRHGTEPNANVNLTHATSFTEFVHELRVEKRSHVHFMPQYAEPWKHRVLESTLAAIREYPDFPEGSRTWDERVFHPDAKGVIQPISTMWPDGGIPWYIKHSLQIVNLMGADPVFSGLRLAFNEPEPEFSLAD